MSTQPKNPVESLSSTTVLKVLNAYAIGAMSRSVAMQRLGLTWYGDLLDAMHATGVHVVIDEDTQQVMRDAIDRIFDAA